MRKYLGIILAITAVFGLLLYFLNLGGRRANLIAYQSDYDSGNLAGVIDRASQALQSDPSDLDALLAMAAAYAEMGSVGYAEKENGQKAIEAADKIIAIDKNNSEAYRIKAYAYEIQEDYDAAHKNYDRAIELNPRNYQALSNKGHAYDLQGSLDKAAEFYQKSLDVYPQNEHGLLNLARLRIRQANSQEAKSTIDKLITSSKNKRFIAEAYQLLAEININEQDLSAASDAIAKSIEFEPTVPQAWVTRGRVRLLGYFNLESDSERQQMVKDVQQYADKALAINKNQASAYLLLSDLMLTSGDQEKRQQFKQQALNAIDLDITLGAAEKKAMRDYLTSDVEIEESSESSEL